MKKIWDSKKVFNKTNLFVVIAIAVIIVCDMITKGLFDYKNINLIEGVVSISWEHNTGAAWSIFSEHTLVLAIVSAIFVIFFCLFDYFGNFKGKLYKISFALILGGTIGNMIDRFLFGYVRDFISADFLVNFPIFNIADSCLVIGVILLCVFFIFVYKDNTKLETTSEVNNESK